MNRYQPIAKEVHAMELSKAAELVGVSSVSLFRELRQRGILTDKNIPLQHYVDQGLFTLSMRQFHLRGTLIKRYYSVVQITPAGMAFISEIARDIRHGRAQSTPTHRQPDSQPAGPVSKAESARRCAALMAALSGNPCAADIPAA